MGPRFGDRKTPEGKAVVPIETAKEEQGEGPTVSFVLVLLLTTALSLIGAPLVEPRYFILPWVIWRLNCPSLPLPPTKSKPVEGSNDQSNKGGLVVFMRYWGWEGHDYRLWGETAWFIVVNAVLGYMFLYRGFEWKQEPGKVQRFMW